MFLWIQFWIGATTLLGVLALMNAPQLWGIRGLIDQYLAGEGYLYGPTMPSDAASAFKLLFAFLIGPAFVMGAPVFLMGYAYPFITALVLRREDSLGRRTGALMACNIAGNVVGSLVSGFVLLHFLGTAGTLALLGMVLMAFGVVAAVRETRARAARAGATGAAAVALFAVFPENDRLWGFLHGATPDRFALIEERSCVNALVRNGDEHMLHLNAAAQNGYPYDDFHVLIGLFPTLLHPAPQRSLAVGLGIGATGYGMLVDPRIQRVDIVEICAGERGLLQMLSDRGSRESRQLLSDPRVDLRVGDGRKHLMVTAQRYDVITVDALRREGAYSGNVYSLEFYRMVAQRLAPNGLFAQWAPTARVQTTVAEAFPYVWAVSVPGSATFLLASNEPIAMDRAAATARLRALAHGTTLSATQRASLERFFVGAELQPVRSGEPRATPTPDAQLNRDLHPRDEYFLNDG